MLGRAIPDIYPNHARNLLKKTKTNSICLESREWQTLWSFFWERERCGERKPVLSKKMGSLSPHKFPSFSKLFPPKELGNLK